MFIDSRFHKSFLNVQLCWSLMRLELYLKNPHYRLVLKQENTQQFYGLQRLRSFWTEMWVFRFQIFFADLSNPGDVGWQGGGLRVPVSQEVPSRRNEGQLLIAEIKYFFTVTNLHVILYYRRNCFKYLVTRPAFTLLKKIRLLKNQFKLLKAFLK